MLPVFTTSTRQDFRPPYRYFIGTAETGTGKINDEATAVIESPVFTLEQPYYALWISGGGGREHTYVALIEADSGQELVRFAGIDSNRLKKIRVAAVWRSPSGHCWMASPNQSPSG